MERYTHDIIQNKIEIETILQYNNDDDGAGKKGVMREER